MIKVFLLQGMITTFFSLLIIKIFNLQIVEANRYKSMALNNKQHLVNIPSYRGEIYTDNGHKKIVENQPSFSIHVVPYQLIKAFSTKTQRKAFIETLYHDFQINPKNFERVMKRARLNPYKSYLLKADLSFQKTAYLAENLDQYPGLLYIGHSKRHYIEGEKYGHITGYVRKINSRQLRKKYYLGYHRDSMVGHSGIEASYDIELRGKDGYRIQIIDAKNRVKHEISPMNGNIIPGNDLILTIDSRIQNIVHQMLQGYTSAAIVTRVQTGEVLALYSHPSYDPNIFTQEVSKQTFEDYINNPNKPFFNRVIQGEYPPSSIFKLVVGLAALSHNKVDFYHTYYECQGGVHIGPQYFKCEGYHGKQNMHHAIANSCNSYFYKMGLSMGSEKIILFSKDYCNFGKKIGLDLPYERKGRVPTHRWKVESIGTFWWDGDTANFAIGQGFLLNTILQINTLTAALANGGTAYKPHLLKRYISVETGKEVYTYEKEPIIKLPLSKAKIQSLQKALRRVITHGTARKGAASSLNISGKTGTAQNVHGESHAWFTCYTTYQEEIIALTVFVEHGGHGGDAAAPFATAILEGICYQSDPLTSYRRIMQAWTSKNTMYQEWLQKRGLKRLPQTFFQKDDPPQDHHTPSIPSSNAQEIH